jgi:hypothetical protein
MLIMVSRFSILILISMKVVTPSFLLLLFLFSPLFLLLVLRLLIYIYRLLGHWGAIMSSVVIAPVLLYIVLFVLDWINLTYLIDIPMKLQMIYSLCLLVTFFLYWWTITKVGGVRVIALLTLVIFLVFFFIRCQAVSTAKARKTLPWISPTKPNFI